jgi:hypothetical protein
LPDPEVPPLEEDEPEEEVSPLVEEDDDCPLFPLWFSFPALL